MPIKNDRQRLDYIMLAIRGKKFGFDKVLKMIDDMVDLLQTEQQNDNDKKEYCEMQLDTADVVVERRWRGGARLHLFNYDRLAH